MRINEIVTETLDEAISVSKYESTIEEAIRTGIAQAMTVMSGLKGRNPEEEKLAVNDRTTPLYNRLLGSLPDVLNEKISKLIQVKLGREIGKDVNLTVSFDETEPNVTGLADNTEIILSNRYLKKLSKEIITRVQNSVTMSYPIEEWVNATFFTFKMLGSQDKYLTSVILSDSEKTIDGIIDTTLHELVHVIQHHRQFQKGRPDTEYRSYLDKKKGEFSNLYGSGPLSDQDKNRYYQLYYASPQEIAAFSHNIAMSMIRAYDIKNAKSKEDLAQIDAGEIVSFVKEYFRQRYSDPKNQKEYAVFKRYAKLVYQEVQRYIENISKSFKNTD